MTTLLLLVIGLALVLIEFYLPGAVMGVLGGCFIFASIVVFAMETGSALLTLAYIIGVAIIVGFLIKFALWRIRTAAPGRSIYLESDQQGYQAASYDESAIGKVGVVLTDLKPGGHILVDGKRQQAISQGGYLPKGTEVIVLSGQEESLIVKRLNKESHQ